MPKKNILIYNSPQMDVNSHAGDFLGEGTTADFLCLSIIVAQDMVVELKTGYSHDQKNSCVIGYQTR